MTTELNI